MNLSIVEPLNVSKEDMNKAITLLDANGIKTTYYDTLAKNNKELLERLKNSDLAIIANSKFPDEVLKNLPKLKYISIAFTGYDHINVELAKELGIKLSNSRAYSDVCVSELVIGHVLNIYRKLNAFEIFKGNEIYNKTVGIIGYGNIGKRTAKLFKAFGAEVLHTSKDEEIDEILKKADIVSLHIPSNEKTKNLINESRFNLMKENAILINCARGAVVNNKDLIKAIKDKKIYAAALDVFDIEPPLPENHELLNKENIYLSPHIAYLTQESMQRRLDICINNIISFVKGKHINSI